MQNATGVTRSEAESSAWSRLGALGPTYGALAALILLIIANIIFTRNFWDLNNFWNILLQVAPTMLVAVGMTFVIATGGIDLSVGSVMAVAASMAAINLEHGIVPAILIALFVTAAIGALNGTLISVFRIQPIIVTLAVLIAGRGLAQIPSEGRLIEFRGHYPAFEALGTGYIGPIPVQVMVMAMIVVAAVFVMRATSFGRYVVAVGGNESASHLAGVKVHRTKIAVYALSGLLAGLAGLIESARGGASDPSNVGLNIELDAIAAVVIGGTALTGGRATIVGTVIGALIMQVITTSFNMQGIAFSWSLVIKAAIIIIAVYVQRPKVA
ncbi:MAG: galactofuranose transport system permease protein [Acidobacteriota bacterium]|jgi:ribose/xylose/arabinose/galactoside ABC-type transport system permease subunit|nr:galactofuranose transport system permease protein [Acidobacteriota bacterium]